MEGERPVQREAVIGHDRQIRVLGRALEHRTLFQTLLLAGPSGVGKGTLCVAVAAALQCEAPNPWACGSCRPCRKITRDLHPDVRYVAPSGTGRRPAIRVDQIREEILAPMSLPPHEGNRLIFLIDPAEALNENAQNALLKALEEPPQYAQFLLVTHSPWGLLPTVRSRCQRMDFSRLSPGEMDRFLDGKLSGEEQDRAAVLAWCAGKPGRLESFQASRYADRRERLLTLLRGGSDPAALPDLLDAAGAVSREEAQEVWCETAEFLRDAVRVSSGLAPRVHREHAPNLEEVARNRGREGMAALIGRLAETPSHLVRNANPRLLWEWVFASEAESP